MSLKRVANVIAPFILFFLQYGLNAQINAYAKVTAVTSNSRLTLSNVNQTFDSFTAGEKIIIIQAQGASINTTNNSSNFGNLNSLNSAGLYEVAEIQAVNGSATSMTLTRPLTNSYSTSGGLQIVSYPRLGTNAYTTTGNINAVSWNGNVGGVIAFYVNGNLNLGHNINASNTGFRGGNKVGNDGGGCEDDVWRTSSGDARYADKGEGIYITSSTQRAGKAKALNGGGGGIVHNGGGGGGGNYTAGGAGYYGYTGTGYCSLLTSAGGQGGLAVASGAGRVFMGGGGGGGQQNDGLGSDGGNGGGIILIECDTIVMTGSCGTRSIVSNGETAADGGNDGCGGGGAGGSIVLDIKGIRVRAGCSLRVVANGGNGGSVGNGSSHGAGGGGGQGAIYMKPAGPFANTVFSTTNGAGGDANSGAAAPNAGSGSGTNGSGINTGLGGTPLPVELISFKADRTERSGVVLSWITATETNNARFEIQTSTDGMIWHSAGSVKGGGNSAEIRNYSFTHTNPSVGQNYYRLRQVDDDGTYSMSGIIQVDFSFKANVVRVFPNPSASEVFVQGELPVKDQVRIMNTLGAEVFPSCRVINAFTIAFDFTELPAGVYLVIVGDKNIKIVVG